MNRNIYQGICRWSRGSRLEFGCTGAGGLAIHHLVFAFAKAREYYNSLFRHTIDGRGSRLGASLLIPITRAKAVVIIPVAPVVGDQCMLTSPKTS
jgi:hypothetical protein